MFGNSFEIAEIKNRISGLEGKGHTDRAEFRQLQSDVRILNDRLHRLLDYFDLEDKWATAQIVAKKVGA